MADSSQLGTALVGAADEALPLFTGLRAVGESGGGTWRGSGTLGTVEVALTWELAPWSKSSHESDGIVGSNPTTLDEILFS